MDSVLPNKDAQKLKVQIAGSYDGEIRVIVEPKENTEVIRVVKENPSKEELTWKDRKMNGESILLIKKVWISNA